LDLVDKKCENLMVALTNNAINLLLPLLLLSPLLMFYLLAANRANMPAKGSTLW
jgi:hypothetical protein